jgi:O-antigen/teichoic acid export membrane protein
MISFLMIPFYTHFLSPGEYGTIELLDLLVGITGIFTGIGINRAIYRYYHLYQDVHDKHLMVSSALAFTAVKSLAVALPAVFVFSELLSRLVFSDTAYQRYIQLMFVSYVFSSLTSFGASYALMMKQSYRYVGIMLTEVMLGLILNIYLIGFLKIGILGFIYSGLITHFVVSLTYVWLTMRQVGFAVSTAKIKDLVVFGAPLISQSVGIFIINYGDRFFLKHYSDLTTVGIYALGYKLGIALHLVVGVSFFQIWETKMYELEKLESGKESHARMYTYYSFVMVFCLLGMGLFTKEVVSIIADLRYYQAHVIVPWIGLAYWLLGSGNFFQIGLLLRQGTRTIGVIMLVTTIVTIGLYFVLIKYFAMWGAVVATLLSMGLMAGLYYWQSQRRYRIDYEFRRIAKLITVGVLLYLPSLFSVGPMIWVVLIKVGLWVAFPGLLFLVGFYTQDELVRIKAVLRATRVMPAFIK